MKVWLIFYRTLALPLTGISLICALQVWYAQTGYFVFRVFWVKFLTSAVIAIFILLFRQEQFVFYNNLGFSSTRLMVSAFLFDFMVWVFLMVFTVSIL